MLVDDVMVHHDLGYLEHFAVPGDARRQIGMEAATPVTIVEFDDRWFLRAALVGGDGAPIDVDAPGHDRSEGRQCAGNGVEAVEILAQAGARDATEETDGVGVSGLVQQFDGAAFFDELTGVEHPDAIAHGPDDAEIVADEEDRRAHLGAEGTDQIEHFGLDGRVEAGGRFVEDQQPRVGGERHGDDDTLGHTTGQFVRVAPHHLADIGDLYAGERLLGARRRLVLRCALDGEHLGDLAADANRRIEGGDRALIHHRDRAATELAHLLHAHRDQVAAFKADLAAGDPAVARQVAHRRIGRRGLAAA